MTKAGENWDDWDDWGDTDDGKSDEPWDDICDDRDYSGWDLEDFEDLGYGIYTDGEGNYYIDIDGDGDLDLETIAPGGITEDNEEDDPWPPTPPEEPEPDDEPDDMIPELDDDRQTSNSPEPLNSINLFSINQHYTTYTESNKNCLKCCTNMMGKMGQTNYGNSSNVIYLVRENDDHSALVHYGDPNQNYTKVTDCINRHLDAGLAIIAGVNHTLEKKINDGTIDHFVLIVAREYNSDSGLYEYLYVETGTNNPGNGYNSGNRFIFDPTIDMYVDNSARIGPIKGGPNTYTLTELRPNDGDNSGTITQPALRIFRFFKI